MPANPSDQQSVEQIEGEAWPEPASDATYVVRRIHQLRRVPVGELSIEDLRIMVSQSVGTVAVLPRVLDLLEENPLSAGDFYPGDLLVATAASPCPLVGSRRTAGQGTAHSPASGYRDRSAERSSGP
ncbi:contact-dependent growth inhibition system immunity protein [Nocardia halotolerans]|uniref:Contact-dependent growth inhibition system immunity protein n=1 Tax=Nocardia halotolerans TaxID=1755878 RepID=A0ABV8VJS1_9NOCA